MARVKQTKKTTRRKVVRKKGYGNSRRTKKA